MLRLTEVPGHYTTNNKLKTVECMTSVTVGLLKTSIDGTETPEGGK